MGQSITDSNMNKSESNINLLISPKGGLDGDDGDEHIIDLSNPHRSMNMGKAIPNKDKAVSPF